MDDRDEQDKALNKGKDAKDIAREDEKEFALFIKQFAPRARSCLAFLLFMLAVQKKLVKLSMQQWCNYLTNNDNWFGNDSYQDGEIPDWLNMDVATAQYIIKSVYKTQMTRSYYQHMVTKADIWDTKNMFIQQAFSTIRQSIGKTKKMEQLVNEVRDSLM